MTAEGKAITLVLADDHPFVLEGVARVLEVDHKFHVLAKCTCGEGALTAISDFRPDVAVLDIAMGDMSGLEILARVHAAALPTRIVFLTANATDANILAAIEQGARALLLKDAPISELAHCIRIVSADGRHFPRDLVSAAVERETGRRSAGERFGRSLTPREREILLLVADGRSNKEIAQQLTLSEGTVRIHMHNIYQKTGIGSRATLTAMALTHRDQLCS